MFLDMWMIILSVAALGLCAILSFQTGVKFGALSALKILIDRKIVRLEGDEIVPVLTEKT
jgi:hypothetical protein